MPTRLTILNQKYFYQHKNGVDFDQNLGDFTVNLARNIMCKAKFNATIEIEWFANSDQVDQWKIEPTQITRLSGNFFNDGFYIGQKFDFITDFSTDNTTPVEFNGTILSISTDGTILTFSVNSGSVTTSGLQDNVGIRATANDSENYLTGLLYKFGIIENDDPFSFQSRLNNQDTVYYADGVGSGVARKWPVVRKPSNSIC